MLRFPRHHVCCTVYVSVKSIERSVERSVAAQLALSDLLYFFYYLF